MIRFRGERHPNAILSSLSGSDADVAVVKIAGGGKKHHLQSEAIAKKTSPRGDVFEGGGSPPPFQDGLA